MAYNVLIFDGTIAATETSGSRLTSNQRDAIQNQVQSLFNQVVLRHDAIAGAKGKKYGGANVRVITAAATVAANELLIYLLPAGMTVATNGKLEAGKPPADHDGLTKFLAVGVASEVYIHTFDMDLVSKLVFHESMHNKLNLDNNGLHPKGGLAAKELTPGSVLTTSNINDMAAALDRDRPQWTGGMQALVSRSQVSDNDPAKILGFN